MTLLEVRKILHGKVVSCGTQRAAAESVGVSPQYFADVLKGIRDPGPTLLAGLGIEKVIDYRTKEAK